MNSRARSRDVKLALKLASTCKHPDARWLTEICAGKKVSTGEEIQAVFLEEERKTGDPRAICFAPLNAWDLQRLHRSAELGYAFAQARMASVEYDEEERFRFASLSAAQGERDGLLQLARCYDRVKDAERQRLLC